MRKLLLSILVYLGTASVVSAQYTTDVNYENSGNRVTVSIQSDYTGLITLFCRFDNLQNANYNNYTPVTRYQGGTFITLNPIDREKGIAYSSANSRYIYGAVDPKIDEDFIYRLPYSAGRETEVNILYDINDLVHNKQEDGKRTFLGYEFSLNQGDTLYAARSGKVVKIIQSANDSDMKSFMSFSTKRNIVHIEHPDGTIAMYNPILDGSMMVKEGDDIECGDPIGLAGSFDGNTFRGRILLSYLKSNPDFNPKENKSQLTNKVYINPWFATNNGTQQMDPGKRYTSVEDAYIRTQGMSKRELKKWCSENKISQERIKELEKRWK